MGKMSRPDIGLIAEEVENIEPLLTTHLEDGQIQGVRYDLIGVVLINAVKEQQRQLDEQEAENRRLKAELDALLSMEDLQKVPFVILGNKIDHPDAVSEDELRHQLGLYQTTGKGKVPLEGIRPIEVFMCSVVMRQGKSINYKV